MIFPDDIVSLISEFSKPLQRIQKSKYWAYHPTSGDKMLLQAMTTFEDYISSISFSYYLQKNYQGKYWTIRAWINNQTYICCILRFSIDDLFKWNGCNFERRYYYSSILNLTEDIIYTYTTQNNTLIKLIKKHFNIVPYACRITK